MISLFLNTSVDFLSVAIVKDDVVLDSFYTKLNNDLSKITLSVIDDMLNRLSISKMAIEKIVCVNGPGSFTGTRIGVTIAKVYGYSLNVDLIPVSTLEVLAGGVNKDYIVPVIDARRGFVYAGIYDKDLNKIVDDRYISLDKLKEELEGKDYVFVSYDDIAGSIKPKIDLIKVINKHEKDIPVNAHGLNPNYLKKTEAEEKLSDKKNN